LGGELVGGLPLFKKMQHVWLKTNATKIFAKEYVESRSGQAKAGAKRQM